MYEITTIGDVTPVSAPQGASTPATIGARLLSIVTDVRAQRTGLIVGLTLGAVGALLYTRLRK